MVRKIEEQTAVNEARMEMALEGVDHQRVQIEEDAQKLQAQELVKQFKVEMGLNAAPTPTPVTEIASPAASEKTIGKKVQEG
jgi:phage shock protein A